MSIRCLWLVFVLLLGLCSVQNAAAQHLGDSIEGILEKSSGEEKLIILMELSDATAGRDTNLSDRYISKGLQIADSLDNTYYRVEFLIKKGQLQADVSKGIGLLKKAIQLASEYNEPRQIANARNLLGTKYFNLSDYTRALENYLAALTIFEDLNYQYGMAQTYNNLGIIYGVYKNGKQAEKYLTKSYNLAKEIHNTNLMTESTMNLGSVNLNSKSYQKALKYFNITVNLADSIFTPEHLAVAYFNIGLVHENMEQYPKALAYYRKCLAATDSTTLHPSKASAMTRQGIVLGILHYENKAIEKLQTALQLAIKIGFKEYQAKSYEALSEIYAGQEQFKQALHYHQLYKLMNDSIYNENSHRQIAEMHTRFELNAIQEANKFLKHAAKTQKMRSVLLIVLIVVSLLAATFFIYTLRYKNISLKQQSLISEREKQVAELNLKKREAETIKAEEESRRLQQEMASQQEITQLKEEQYQNELQHKDRELSTSALHMISKNAMLKDVYGKLETVIKNDQDQMVLIIGKILHEIKNNIRLDENWGKFKVHFEEVHPGFFTRLVERYPDFTNNDVKLCAYLRINLDSKEIAQILNISLSALEKRRHRLRKKAALSADVDLVRFMQNF